MVSTTLQPKDFFIYGNGKKLWVVLNNQIIDIKDYMIDSFGFTIDNGYVEQELLGGATMPMFGRQTMEFDLHAVVTDATFETKENVDVSDFYDIEECKNLSKIIQRKFDKIFEESEKEDG